MVKETVIFLNRFQTVKTPHPTYNAVIGVADKSKRRRDRFGVKHGIHLSMVPAALLKLCISIDLASRQGLPTMPKKGLYPAQVDGR